MTGVMLYFVMSAIVLFVLLSIQGGVGTAKVGMTAAAGSRDDLPDPLPGYSKRMKRVVRNHVEGLVLATPIFLAAALSPEVKPLAILGAQVFFVSRVAHAVIYMLGVPWIRTAAFLGGLTGLTMMFISLL